MVTGKITPVGTRTGNISSNVRNVGTTDHSKLENRDLTDQHPISAITGLQEKLNNTQSKLTPGENITIDDNNVISSTGGQVLEAGNGIFLEDNKINVANTIECNTDETADVGGRIKLTPGNNFGKIELIADGNDEAGKITVAGSIDGKGKVSIDGKTNISGPLIVEDIATFNEDIYIKETIKSGTNGEYSIILPEKDGTLATLDDIVGEEKYTNENPTTISVGGVEKGTTFNNKTMKEMWDMLLYPYVAFTFTGLSGGSTVEYGTPVTVTKVTPAFTNGSQTINSVKIGSIAEEDDLYSATSITDGTITLTNSKTFDGTTNGSIYCTLSDGKTKITQATSVTHVKYNYYALTNDDTAPTSWTRFPSSGDTAEITVSYLAGQRLWIASDSSSKAAIQVYNPLSKTYTDIGTGTEKKAEKQAILLNSGITVEYTVYKSISGMAADGTNMKFKLR